MLFLLCAVEVLDNQTYDKTLPFQGSHCQSLVYPSYMPSILQILPAVSSEQASRRFMEDILSILSEPKTKIISVCYSLYSVYPEIYFRGSRTLISYCRISGNYSSNASEICKSEEKQYKKCHSAFFLITLIIKNCITIL